MYLKDIQLPTHRHALMLTQVSSMSLLLCRGEECGIWQHCSCVGLQPPRPMPEHFFCESCTCERANPFWRNSSSERRMLLPPALLQPQQLPVS